MRGYNDYNNVHVSLFFGFIFGLAFYPLYKWDITRKLRKIKDENVNASNEELISIVSKKGGISSKGLIIFLIVYIIFIYLLNIILLL